MNSSRIHSESISRNPRLSSSVVGSYIDQLERKRSLSFDTIVTSPEIMTVEEEEEKARAEAEARRQRILNSADDRMDTVTTGGGGKTSNASKLAAMRRRRFKKKEPKEGEDDKAKEEGTAKDATTAPVEEPAEEMTTPDTQDDEVLEEISTPGAASMSENKPKKYMGVAKMRRKMIQEKKERDEASKPTASSKAPRSTTRMKRPVEKLPIIMHAVVVVLLFVAGLDVGLQQGIDYGSDAVTVVETSWAPQEELRFLRLIPKALRPALPSDEVDEEKVVIDEPEEPDVHREEDEFGETVKKEDDFPEQNIDPLFGLDLDMFTAGPGIVNFMGRQAVKVHRALLSIFYFFPQRIVFGLYDTFLQLLTLPPILCIIALTLRQVVGKTILGAKLPEKVVDKSQRKDVMTMIKNFVSGFVLKRFPTAVSLYDGWANLRADMYVVVCGLMVGLAWSHSSFVAKEKTAAGDRDEL